MPQSKDTDWQIGQKAKLHQCAVSRKHILHERTQNKGMEEELPRKWREKQKQKQELQS